MPVFDYQCKKCGKVEEVYHRPEKCSDCDGEMVRLWTSPAIIYNANGFYCTDNKKK